MTNKLNKVSYFLVTVLMIVVMIPMNSCTAPKEQSPRFIPNKTTQTKPKANIPTPTRIAILATSTTTPKKADSPQLATSQVLRLVSDYEANEAASFASFVKSQTGRPFSEVCEGAFDFTFGYLYESIASGRMTYKYVGEGLWRATIPPGKTSIGNSSFNVEESLDWYVYEPRLDLGISVIRLDSSVIPNIDSTDWSRYLICD